MLYSCASRLSGVLTLILKQRERGGHRRARRREGGSGAPPGLACSWRTLCFSPLLHGKLQAWEAAGKLQVQRGKMEEQRARITPRHVPELVERPCGHGEEAAHALACLLLVVGGSQVKRASKGLDVHVGEAGLARWARSQLAAATCGSPLPRHPKALEGLDATAPFGGSCTRRAGPRCSLRPSCTAARAGRG